MRKFINEILLLQILATYLVILGHSYPFTIEFPHALLEMRTFLYAFHMALFVWISGYLLIYSCPTNIYPPPQSTQWKTVGRFVRKRFIKLLTPYFVLSILAIIPKFAVQQYLNDEIELDPLSVLRIFFVPRENVWGHFWFLPMIFALGVLGFLLNQLFRKYQIATKGWILTTIISFGIYACFYKQDISGWFSLNDLIAYGWLFSLGALCANLNFLEKTNANLFKPLLLFILANAIFLIKLPYALSPYKDALIALAMIYFLVIACQLASKYIRIDRSALYAQTFTIFLLSWPMQAICNVLVERLLHMPYYILMPLQFLSGVVGPMIIIFLIEKIEQKIGMRWLNHAIGK